MVLLAIVMMVGATNSAVFAQDIGANPMAPVKGALSVFPSGETIVRSVAQEKTSIVITTGKQVRNNIIVATGEQSKDIETSTQTTQSTETPANTETKNYKEQLLARMNSTTVRNIYAKKCVGELSYGYIQENYSEDSNVETEYNSSTSYTGEGKYIGICPLTAYCATGHNTASGTVPTVGRTVACNSLPFGTQIHIVGHGTFVVEDRGPGLGSNGIDIFLGSYEEAINFGHQSAEVWVIG